MGLLDGGQGQLQGLVGNQLMLLGHRIHRQRQEVQQLGVAEGPQAQRPRLEREVMQGIEHPLQQHIRSRDQRIRQMPQALQQLLHQLPAAIATEGLAMLHQHLAGEARQRLLEARATILADAQLGACADQHDLLGLGLQQAAGQLQAGLLIVADHRAEQLGLHHPVDGNDWQALGLQGAVAVIVGGQATGDEQGVATPCAKQLQQLPLAVRGIVGAGDQQLITTGAGALFQQLGDPGVTGVFQVRQDKPEGARASAAQPGGLGVGGKAVLLDHRAHPLDGGVADALLFGFAVDDVTGGCHRHTGQPGYITEFQPGISLFFWCLPDIFVNPTR